MTRPPAPFIRNLRWNFLRKSGPVFVLLVLIGFVAVLRPEFARPETLVVVAADTVILFILAAGITFAVILGGIDLSIQAVASLASVLVAALLPRLGPWAFPAALGTGLAAGTFSGLVHTLLRIPSFIVTLATTGLVSAAALVISQERAITIGESGRDQLTWITGQSFGLPNIVWIGLLVGVGGIMLQRYTAFGRYCLAIGAGEPATWASGVKVNRQKVIAYALSGGLSALAGILLAGRLSSGSPTLANELLLPAVAAVVVGGTAITGGAGGIALTAIGALIISVVRIGMTFLGINIFAQQIVFGIVLIAAVAVTIDRKKILIVK